MGFLLTSRSMTLDDFKLNSCNIKFRDTSRVSEAITAKRMKTDPHCQRRNCSPLNVIFSDALISQGVPQLGGVKQRWDGKTSFHSHRLSRAYLAL